MPTTHDPIADFLAPLFQLGQRFPDAEGHVLWDEGGAWVAQDETDEGLDGEEIAYYAEGLLLEGFALTWQAIAPAESPTEIEHVLMFFRQNPALSGPDLPSPAEGWVIARGGQWPS